MKSHARYLVQELGFTKEQIIRARAGEDVAELTDLQRLLVRFARKVATVPKGIGEKDIEALRAAGLDDNTIVEVVSVCSFSAFTNTFTDTLKMADDLERMGLEKEFF